VLALVKNKGMGTAKYLFTLLKNMQNEYNNRNQGHAILLTWSVVQFFAQWMLQTLKRFLFKRKQNTMATSALDSSSWECEG
jgi:hypothetical protein